MGLTLHALTLVPTDDDLNRTNGITALATRLRRELADVDDDVATPLERRFLRRLEAAVTAYDTASRFAPD